MIPATQKFRLIGITDTAMLRPQVFAYAEGDVQVGLDRFGKAGHRRYL